MKPADYFKALLQEKLLSHMKDASTSSFWSRFWARRFFVFATAFAVLVAAVFVSIFVFRGKDFILPEPTLVKAGSQAVPVNFPISVSFPYEIPVEILRQHFSITPFQEGELIFQDKVLTFTPGKFFRFGTEYTLKVAKEAFSDMSEDFILTFKTFDRSQKPFYISNYGALGHYFLSFYETDPQILMDIPEQGKYRMNVFKIDPGKMLDYIKNFEDSGKLDSIIPSFKKESVQNLEFTLQDANASQYIYKPSFKDAGLYYVEIAPAQVAKGQPSVYRFFITYSRYAVSTKRLGDKLVSWALDTKTGTGVSDTRVTGYGEDFQKVLFTDRTNESGLFQKTFENKDEQEHLPRAMIFDFQDEKVVALLRLNYGYNLFDVDWSNRRPEHKAYTMLDRPLYRPGDTVHFKSWIRKSDTLQFDRKYRTVRVEVTRDEYGSPMDTIFKGDLPISEVGSFGGDVILSKEVRTGAYSLRLKFDDHEISKTRFNIEIFQKPDFEINLDTGRDSFIAGEDMDISVSGRYFFGSPVKGQNVSLQIGNYEKLPPFLGSFDDNGVFHQKIPASFPVRDNNDLWLQDGISIPVSATVREDTGKVSTKTKMIQWYPSEYSIHISDPAYLRGLDPRKKINFIFYIQKHDEQKQKGVEGVSVKVNLVKKDWVKVEDSQYGRYEEKETPVFENKILTTNFDGEASLEYEFSQGGSYEFRYSITDSRGNVLNIREDFWIRDPEYGYYYDRLAPADSKILIIPEKDSYKIGEKARVKVFMMQDQGDAFLSLNTNSFKKIWTEQITANPQIFEFDVTDDLAPAFYFFVETYQGDSFVTGLQKISVTGKKLQITVTPSGKSAYPKEKISLNVETKDENGNPVASDSAITVIDKAILALKDDENKPFFDTFYEEPRSHFMSRFTNVDPLVVGFAEKGGCFLAGTKILMADGSLKNIEDIVSGDEILTKESDFSLRLVSDKVVRVFRHIVGEYYIINGTLRVTGVHRVFVNDRWTTVDQIQIGDFFRDVSGKRVQVRSIEKKINQVKVYNFETEKYHTYFADGVYVHNQKGDEESSPRKNFVDTAYWNAFVQTGADGKGKVEFEVPDNLTTWVSLIKGMTGDTKLGEGRGEFVVSKSLLIRPVLPQFLRTSDEMTLIAAIHNNSSQQMTVKVLIKATGVQIANETLQEISLSPNSSGNIYWKIKADNAKEAHFTFSANEVGGKKVDTVEMTVPIYSSLNLDRVTFTGNGEKGLQFSFDKKGDASIFHRAVLTVTSSVTGILPDVIEKLIGYPYGCVEQTMSKHLPNVFAKKYSSLLGVKLPENIDQTLKDGLDRLKKFQHADGGFGWWEEDQTNIWMTGYVMEGLQMIKELDMLAGYESMYDQTLNYLLNTVANLQSHERIYISYVLARTKSSKFKDENLYDDLLNVQEKTVFTPQDYGYVALALHYINDKKGANDVVKKYILPGLKDSHWEQEMDYISMSDRYSTTGVNLLALIEIEGEKQEDVIKNIVQWLMNHRQGYEGLWGSTRQSSQILVGLIRYIQEFDEFDANYNYKIALNGEAFAGGDVDSPKYSKKFEIAQRRLSKQNELEFFKRGNGNLFYTLEMDQYVEDYELRKKAASDIFIKRNYLNAEGEIMKEFSFGEIVTVQLQVKIPANITYLMVQDFLPAGFEPINDRLTRQQMASYFGVYSGEVGPFFEEGFYDFGSDPIDIRDEKVVLFRQYGGADQTFSYRARAVKKGAFMAPSSKVESMYDPEKFASGDQMFVTVK